MDTPIEESNLAHIGSDEDKALKKAAAETEVNWEIAGKKEGIQIWRVENRRDENDNPKFGIQPWPENRYGDFYRGDSYILLETTKNEESGSFLYDIYFWIGAESSQDEYGVAAYKANELDDLLDDAPVQHREVQFHESQKFLKCLNNRIKYLDGGFASGFRNVNDDSDRIILPTRLYHVRRENRVTRCVQVPAECSSLNQGDAFVLCTSSAIYTWFGEEASPFEKSKAAEVAHNMAAESAGTMQLVQEVEDDNDEFWSAIGGKGDIQGVKQDSEVNLDQNLETKMYVLSDVDSILKVEECEASRDSLVSGDVCIISSGNTIYIWLGQSSSIREQNQAMILAQRYAAGLGLQYVDIVRVKEGQEKRISGFDSMLP